MNIFEKIYNQSKFCKKKILLDQNYYYSNFYNLITKYLDFLKSSVKKKQIVCIDSKYSIDLLAIIIAARLNKNTICILNPSQTSTEKNNILKQANCSMLLSEKINKSEKKINNFYYELRKNKKVLNKTDAFIIFTSGTTSKPKGAILTDKSVKNNVLGIIRQLNFSTNDRTIIYTPPNYAMGISQMITFLYLRSSILLDNEGVRFADIFLKKIKKYKITILNLNVASFKYLKVFKKSYKLPNLKMVMSGGMKMTGIDAKEIFKFFNNKSIVNFYGCTENSPRISHFKFTINQLKKFKESKILPVGKPLDGTKVKIRKFKKEIQKNYGEINLSGNSLMRTYLDFRFKNKKIVKYNTKDIGYISSDKNIFVIGRTDNIFKSGNEKISPEEIEDRLRPYLKKKNFIIIKKKHQILNWEPALVIEGFNSSLEDKLIKNISNELSNFKIPKKIYYIKNFYRNNYGKIDRSKIYNQILKNAG
tara:strand:+ start:467 stop:1894 length:1428 start_codon:yes stop_codon:yes gene_type:complete